MTQHRRKILLKFDLFKRGNSCEFPRPTLVLTAKFFPQSSEKFSKHGQVFEILAKTKKSNLEALSSNDLKEEIPMNSRGLSC